VFGFRKGKLHNNLYSCNSLGINPIQLVYRQICRYSSFAVSSCFHRDKFFLLFAELRSPELYQDYKISGHGREKLYNRHKILFNRLITLATRSKLFEPSYAWDKFPIECEKVCHINDRWIQACLHEKYFQSLTTTETESHSVSVV